jgi:hypothetical protein
MAKKKNFSWGKSELSIEGKSIGKSPSYTPVYPGVEEAPRAVAMEPKESIWARLRRKEPKEPRDWKSWGQKDIPVRKTALQGASYGLGATTRNMARSGEGIRQLGSGVRDIGGAITSFPAGGMIKQVVDVFTLAWSKMSSTIKSLIVIVFFVAILFVPWGVFYYAGWAVGAAFMFLISMIYWVFVNIFNALASGIIAVVNGVASIFMGFIIWIVEAIMHIFLGSGWQWWNGRGLMENSLISYHAIAPGGAPALLSVQAPVWQNWFNTTLIVKLLEHIPGAQAFIDAYNTVVVGGIHNAFSGFVGSAPGWMIIVVGLIPLLATISVLVYVYYKNKGALQPY